MTDSQVQLLGGTGEEKEEREQEKNLKEYEGVGKDRKRNHQDKGKVRKESREKKGGSENRKAKGKKQLLVYLLCMRTYGAGLLTFVIIETMALSGSSPFESVRIISSPKSQKSCLGKEAKGEVLWTKHRALPALKVLEQIR